MFGVIKILNTNFNNINITINNGENLSKYRTMQLTYAFADYN